MESSWYLIISFILLTSRLVNGDTNPLIDQTKPQDVGVTSVNVAVTGAPLSPMVMVDDTIPTTNQPDSTLSQIPGPVNFSRAQLEAQFKGYKFTEYLRPICNSLDRLDDALIKKINQNLKIFIEKTRGQLSQCFIEKFGLDPVSKLMTLADLISICPIKHLMLESKQSYREFQMCAASKWTPESDRELTRVLGNRLIGASHHVHFQEDPNLDAVHHDNDDISLVNNIVKQILADEQSLRNDSEFKFIDVSDKNKDRSPITTVAPSDETVIVWLNDTQSQNQTSTNVIESKIDLPPERITERVPEMKPLGLDNHGQDGGGQQANMIVTNKPQVQITISAPNTTTTTTSKPSIKPESKPISVKIIQSPDINRNWTNKTSTTVKPASKVLTKMSDLVYPRPNTVRPEIKLDSGTKEPNQMIKLSLVSDTKDSKSPGSSGNLIPILESIRRYEEDKSRQEKKLKAEREKSAEVTKRRETELATIQAIKSLQKQSIFDTKHQEDKEAHKLEHDRQMVSIIKISYIN